MGREGGEGSGGPSPQPPPAAEDNVMAQSELSPGSGIMHDMLSDRSSAAEIWLDLGRIPTSGEAARLSAEINLDRRLEMIGS